MFLLLSRIVFSAAPKSLFWHPPVWAALEDKVRQPQARHIRMLVYFVFFVAMGRSTSTHIAMHSPFPLFQSINGSDLGVTSRGKRSSCSFETLKTYGSGLHAQEAPSLVTGASKIVQFGDGKAYAVWGQRYREAWMSHSTHR